MMAKQCIVTMYGREWFMILMVNDKCCYSRSCMFPSNTNNMGVSKAFHTVVGTYDGRAQ